MRLSITPILLNHSLSYTIHTERAWTALITYASRRLESSYTFLTHTFNCCTNKYTLPHFAQIKLNNALQTANRVKSSRINHSTLRPPIDKWSINQKYSFSITSNNSVISLLLRSRRKPQIQKNGHKTVKINFQLFPSSPIFAPGSITHCCTLDSHTDERWASIGFAIGCLCLSSIPCEHHRRRDLWHQSSTSLKSPTICHTSSSWITTESKILTTKKNLRFRRRQFGSGQAARRDHPRQRC